MLNFLLILLASVGTVVTAINITYSQFLGLQFGWERNQIIEYLNDSSGFDGYGPDRAYYQYLNTNSSGSLSVYFDDDDKLRGKEQSGLKAPQCWMNSEQHWQIELNHMSKSQVTSFLGCEGTVTDVSKDLLERDDWQRVVYRVTGNKGCCYMEYLFQGDNTESIGGTQVEVLQGECPINID